jgi:hypothetical protein
MSALYLEGAAALALTAAMLTLAQAIRLVGADACSWRRARWLALVIGLAALVPADGVSAARLLLTLSPSLSLSTVAFSLAAIAAAISQRPLIRRAELNLLGVVVLAASLPLFASVLRLWPLDLYLSGYRFSWLDLAVAGCGILAAWRGFSAIALVMLGALVAQFFHLLPSGNLWDGLTDGLAFLVALGLVGRAAAGWLASRRRRPV